MQWRSVLILRLLPLLASGRQDARPEDPAAAADATAAAGAPHALPWPWRPRYDEKEALRIAYLVTAAYCGFPALPNDTFLEAWDCGPACDRAGPVTSVRAIRTPFRNDAYAYVGRSGGSCLLAFRGTSDLSGWIADLRSARLVDTTSNGVPCSFEGKPCYVGEGFLRNYLSISEFIKGNLSAIGCDKGSFLSRGLTVTGHSLGAAEAVIAMYDLRLLGYKVLGTITMGQPRVGNKVFAQAFMKLFGTSAMPFRVTHANDFAPHLPFEALGFYHVGTEVFYPGNVSLGFKMCNASIEDPLCSNQFIDVPLMALSCLRNKDHCPHLTYMQELDNLEMSGLTCRGRYGEAGAAGAARSAAAAAATAVAADGAAGGGARGAVGGAVGGVADVAALAALAAAEPEEPALLFAV